MADRIVALQGQFLLELKMNLEKRATLSILERVGWAA